MQCKWNSDLPWLSGPEQDFPLGAKATSCLPSATHLDHDFNNDAFELPDWMESRENLGLSNIDLFDDIKFPEKTEHDISYQVSDGIPDMEDDYSQTMKPEDMLVPLSELQPETYTPQGIGANTLSAASSIPKVSVRVNKVQVAIPEQRNHAVCVLGIQPSFQNQLPQNSNYHLIPYSEVIQPIEHPSNYNADELFNQLVNMAGKEPNGLTNLLSSFSSSVVEAGMDDLLSQLESSNAKNDKADISPWTLEPASPVSMPSPVPSIGSLSPQSTGDTSFHHQTPTYTINDTAIQPEYGKKTFLSLLSPDDSFSGDSVSYPSLIGDEESESEYSRSEMHSYSRPPRKNKTSRKTPYPEGRKERKKEQNKQAALRYRHKKKQEDDVLLAKIAEEEKRQEQLKSKFSNLKQELCYLKKIMREVFIAKGILSPDALKKN